MRNDPCRQAERVGPLEIRRPIFRQQLLQVIEGQASVTCVKVDRSAATYCSGSQHRVAATVLERIGASVERRSSFEHLELQFPRP